MSDHKPVALHIIEQGAVRVSAAYVYREAPGIVCIYVDLHSKWVEVMATGSGDSLPLICLADLDETRPRNSLTILELPDYEGWELFACAGPSPRYTLAVVLVRPDAKDDA